MNPLSPLGHISPAPPVISSGLSQTPTSLPQSASSAPTVAVPQAAVQPVGAGQSGRNMGDATGQQANNPQQLREAVEKMQKVVSVYNNELRFSIDEETGASVVKVMDTSSGEVLRQIPSEEMLELAKHLDKVIGVFVKQQA